MTIRDLIGVALLKLGILRVGGTVSAQQGQAGVRCLMSLLDTLPIEPGLVYTIDRQLFALVANTQTYTLGPGGTWNTTPLYTATTPRPPKIHAAWWHDTTNEYEQPVHIMEDAEYRSLNPRTMTSTQVQALYYEPTMPQGRVFVWPKPTQAATMVLYLAHPFDGTVTLDSALGYPPGYQRFFEFGLAFEMGTEYPAALAANPVIITEYDRAKRLVTRANVRIPKMRNDLVPTVGGFGTRWARFIAGEE